MDKESDSKKPIYKKWWFWVVVIFVVIVATASSDGSKNTNTDVDNPDEAVKEEVIDDGNISEHDAELFCQDANLLGKFLELDRISVIKMTDYNLQYVDGGASDADGTPIKLLSWNGKYKENDETIRFSCWVSGKKDDIKLMYLSVNNISLYGSLDF